MKRSMYIVISALVMALTMLSAAWAVETKEEKNLQKESTEINATADTEKGATVVTQRLEKEFGVTGAQVQALRDKKLGYGEVAIVLSLAQKMPGGITDANIQSVMTLREGPPVMGWGEIAKKLGFKLGPTISQVMSVNKSAEREMKGVKGQMERNEERHNERHGEMSGHGGGMGDGQGMSHGKGL